MDIRIVTGPLAGHDTPLLVAFQFEGDASPAAGQDGSPLAEAVQRAAASGDLDGKKGQANLFHGGGGADGPARLLILGGGRPDDCDAETLRRLAGSAVRAAEKRRIPRLTVDPSGVSGMDAEIVAQSVAEGAALAAWRFDELKTGPGQGEVPPARVEAVEIVAGTDEAAARAGAEVGAIVGEAENFARTLQARPGNVATPTHLAEVSLEMGEELGLDVRVLGPAEMREEGMHALLAVAQGSDQEPRLIVMEHRGGPAGAAPLALVGKGLTFDAGGISLKPPKGMEDMKFDMSGGAAVIAAMRGIARLGVPANVVGIVPSSENLMNGRAVKPGDVIGSREGKSIEVINTDAEGRLILADALSYAQTFAPEAIVDCATLTGSCVIALGHQASAVLGTDEGLIQELREAGERTGERCWPLPLWPEYRKQLESTSADFMNVGGRPAGTITAACFLREFVGDATWAHLDIAGTAYGEGTLSYQRKGGFGVPTRMLIDWVRRRAA